MAPAEPTPPFAWKEAYRGSQGVTGSTPVVETWWQLIRWSDGKCIWWRNFATEAEARGAIRLQAR